MMNDAVIFNQEKNIGFIRLNRPEALNALTLEMVKAISQQLRLWDQDPSIHAVILEAATGRAFCAGGDVRWLYEAGKRQDPVQMQFFEHEYQMNFQIHHFSKPYVALMDGMTMGGGVGVALHGSHPVASERFVFAMPETAIGFFPDIGASYLLNRCPGATGLYLGLSGERINAQEALSLNLVSQVSKADDFPLIVEALKDLDLSVDSHLRVSDCLRSFALLPEETELDEWRDLIEAVFVRGSIESMLEALSLSGSDWASSLAASLSTKSPFSLKLTLAQLRHTVGLSLAECLQLDYTLVGHFMRGHDFYEGVRALLVDKDRKPQWRPASLAEVDDSAVEAYFKPWGKALKLD